MSSLPIVDARRQFKCTFEERAASLARHVKETFDLDLPTPTKVSKTPALRARVNCNRWIVDCPDCRSAEYLFVDAPVFMCSNCLNGTVEGLWRRVVIPKDREQIEQALRARPVPANRNWEPGEAVTMLRMQNEERGLIEEVG